uniref:Uncharacterized protein n=1 Tax=Rhizophora mucronata TaxID=61149 RepID=A0A2P2PET0_RHIMU
MLIRNSSGLYCTKQQDTKITIWTQTLLGRRGISPQPCFVGMPIQTPNATSSWCSFDRLTTQIVPLVSLLFLVCYM